MSDEMSVRSSANALTLCSLDHANLITFPEGFDFKDGLGGHCANGTKCLRFRAAGIYWTEWIFTISSIWPSEYTTVAVPLGS